MRALYLIPVAFAALMAGATVASAHDDPPGWEFQKRGIIEMNGGDPLHRHHYGYYRGWRGGQAWGPSWRYRHHPHYGYWR